MQTNGILQFVRTYHNFGLAILIALASVSCSSMSRSKSNAKSWRPLFDGTSKEGWAMTGPGEFRLENGELGTSGGMGLFWYTREKFGDAQIRVVFTLSSPEDNSGVFIRIPAAPPDPWFAVNRGFEVQIDNSGDDYHRMGCLYSLTKALNVVSAKVGEWNTMVSTLDGTRTIVEVNGVKVTDYVDGEPVPPKVKDYEPNRGPRPDHGYIGLQNHDDHTRTRFKEVSVRPL